ncbi:MAG: hypothetical protein U0641_05615 [Anaerolineae bacterium]
MTTITAPSLTEGEVSDFVGLAVVEENGGWGVDATEFIEVIEDLTGVFLPNLHPDHLDALSLHLSYALFTLNPSRQIQRLLEFARFLRYLTERGYFIEIINYQNA